MDSFAPSAIALSPIFAISVVLTASRSPVPDDQLNSVRRLVLIACAAQLLHLLEESAFDLHVVLPEAFGFPGMSLPFFLSINTGALVVWLLGALQRTFNPLVVTTFWFLGLASVFNLVAHPTMAIVTGGYFPGVLTSPLVGFTGLLLTRRLFQATGDALGSGPAA